jgi:hypothetical protein
VQVIVQEVLHKYRLHNPPWAMGTNATGTMKGISWREFKFATKLLQVIHEHE